MTLYSVKRHYMTLYSVKRHDMSPKRGGVAGCQVPGRARAGHLSLLRRSGEARVEGRVGRRLGELGLASGGQWSLRAPVDESWLMH